MFETILLTEDMYLWAMVEICVNCRERLGSFVIVMIVMMMMMTTMLLLSPWSLLFQ